MYLGTHYNISSLSKLNSMDFSDVIVSYLTVGVVCFLGFQLHRVVSYLTYKPPVWHKVLGAVAQETTSFMRTGITCVTQYATQQGISDEWKHAVGKWIAEAAKREEEKKRAEAEALHEE